MRIGLTAAFLAFCLFGAATAVAHAAESPASDGRLALSPDVLAAFETYRQAPRPGAFAVSEDGGSFGQSLCDEPRCDRGAQRRAALQACSQDADSPCVLFASGVDIRLAYRELAPEELSACPLAPAPTIRVALSIGDAAFDRSKTVAELSHLMFDDERHWIDEEGVAMGVTEQFFDIDRYKIDVIEIEGRDGVRCVGYKDGVITVTLGATIFVAKEIPDDSCLYREVLAHEHRHRDLGRSLTEKFARDLEARIAEQLGAHPFAELSGGDTPWSTGGERLRMIIETAHGEFHRDHSRQQLAIDSNREYQRVDLACPGESEKYTQ